MIHGPAAVSRRLGVFPGIADKERTLIAFIRQDDPPPAPPALRRARRLVASTLLYTRRRHESPSPRVPAWLEWGFAAWVSAVTVIYGLHMIGWL